MNIGGYLFNGCQQITKIHLIIIFILIKHPSNVHLDSDVYISQRVVYTITGLNDQIEAMLMINYC